MMRVWEKPESGDLLAGISVALLLIPQSLAYAQIADMPPVTGLFASALPLIIGAPFASSPYLQTGPVALTSLLTLAALQGAGFAADDPDYVVMAAMLAVLVGVFRLLLGLMRGGWVAYLIAEPVLIGFTSAAAVLILSSQLPKALGNSLEVPGTSTLGNAIWAVTHPASWEPAAIGLSAVTLLVMLGGRRLHRLFPGVALAVVVGLVFSRLVDDPGLTVGDPEGVPEGLPELQFDLPWGSAGVLVVGALVIALVGFAEPAAISRIFAAQDKARWNANLELIRSGVANLASGFSGAFPVGGSFSRSSLNRMAGARTKWSGGITGVVVLGFLPFAGVLDPLPQAILGAIVVGAVLGLLSLKRLVTLFRVSWTDAGLAWLTWGATLVLAPNVQYAVIIGLGATIVVQLARPLRLQPTTAMLGPGHHGRATTWVETRGLLWLGSYRRLGRQLNQVIADHPGHRMILDIGEAPSIDPLLEQVLGDASAAASGAEGKLMLRHELPLDQLEALVGDAG